MDRTLPLAGSIRKSTGAPTCFGKGGLARGGERKGEGQALDCSRIYAYLLVYARNHPWYMPSAQFHPARTPTHPP